MLQSSQRINISRRTDTRVFTDYPVQILAGKGNMQDLPRISPEATRVMYTSVKSIQLPATLFFAAVHPSISVLFDDTFAKITAIAFYGSPPMTVLDEAILSFKNITIIPFRIPNLFSWLLYPNNCEPSFMLKRYEYECEFAENFGVDLTIFLFIATVMGLLKLSAYLANRQTKEDTKPNQVSDNESLKTNKQQGPRVEKVTFAESMNWLRRNFGFVLMWAKVEGKQTAYLVFAFQDFSSNDGSKNRILSTLVATVCLSHVVFSLWGTQKLKSFITSFYNLSFSNRVTQIVNLPIEGLDEHSLKIGQPKNGLGESALFTSRLTRKQS